MLNEKVPVKRDGDMENKLQRSVETIDDFKECEESNDDIDLIHICRASPSANSIDN